MANRLELPDDLQKLIEKREQTNRRQPDAAAAEEANAAPAPQSAERRSGADRRTEE